MKNSNQKLMFGLTNTDIQLIKKAVGQFPEIEDVLIFGSRAMLNFKKGSDIDLAIKGKNVTDKIISKLSSILNEELPLPYFFDIVHYESIQNTELKRHIDQMGRSIL